MSNLTLNEILNLDSKDASIKKIDAFLEEKDKNSYQYIKALTIKAIIMHNLGKISDALKMLYNYIPLFNQLEDASIITICDAIILICTKIKRFDQVEKYIELKKQYLPISKENLYLKDKINLYLEENKKTEAKNLILKYNEEDITKDERMWAYDILINIYYDESDLVSYYDIFIKLKEYYLQKLDNKSYEKIVVNLFRLYLLNEDYVRILSEKDNYDISSFSDANKLFMASFIIKAYIENNDLKKAAIVESDFIDYLSDEDVIASLEFASEAIEIYIKTNTLNIIDEYKNKIEHYNNLLNKGKKEEKKRLKEESNALDVKIPIIKKSENISPINLNNEIKTRILNKPQNEIINVVKNYKNVDVSSFYSKLSEAMNKINSIDLGLKFREVLRLSLIEINKLFNFDEAYLLILNPKYKGFHYKKERLYDKTMFYRELQGTCNLESIEKGIECFYDNTDKTYNMDIVNKKPYETDTYVISLPLKNNLDTYASIAYIANSDFLNDELSYEGLKILSLLLSNSILYSISKENYELSNQKLLFLYKNNEDGIKEMHDNKIHLSDSCVNILDLLPDITIDDFYHKMSSIDVMNYKNALNKIYNLDYKKVEVKYKYNAKGKDIFIKEVMIPLNIDGVIYIMSFVKNITEEKKKIDTALDLAYKNPITKLNTEILLLKDLDACYREDRVFYLYALSIYDLKLFEDIYGYNIKTQILYSVALFLEDILSSDFNSSLYYCYNQEYIILIKDINDKRIALSKIKDILSKLKDKFILKSSRMSKIYFDVGIYRRQKSSKVSNTQDFIQYVNDALGDSRQIKSREDHISFYDGDKNKEIFAEKELITTISEAIDQNRVSLQYQQIIDIVDSNVYGYYVTFNLESKETLYENLLSVAKRKGILQDLEKHSFYRLCLDLKNIKDNIKTSVNAFINISSDTIDNMFYEFVLTQAKFFKINPNYVIFIVNSANNLSLIKLRNEGFKICSKDIMDIYRDNCDYFLYDYNLVTYESISEVKELCLRHNIRIILNNALKKDLETIRMNKYDLLIGHDMYSKNRRISDLVLKLKKDLSR